VPQANVELHQASIEAWNRRDLEAFLALADPEVEIAPLNVEMERMPYRGRDGVRRFWNDYLAVFPDFRVEVIEIRELGAITVASVRLRGHGTESDASFVQPTWQVAAWHDEKCVWWRSFRTELEAVKAARRRGGQRSG
jgi:ketosteroid isomerase-like protein